MSAVKYEMSDNDQLVDIENHIIRMRKTSYTQCSNANEIIKRNFVSNLKLVIYQATISMPIGRAEILFV